MGTHAPGRVMSMIKQQAAMLTHHQWAQVRAALCYAQPDHVNRCICICLTTACRLMCMA